MLNNPDLAPSASMNRWIVAILTFHFHLVHVPGTSHGPDGLSRRPPQPGDEPAEDPSDFEDWIDRVHGFLHQILPHPARSAAALRDPTRVFALATATEDGHDLSGGEDSEADEANQQSKRAVGRAAIRIASENEAATIEEPEGEVAMPYSDAAKAADERLRRTDEWLRTLQRPVGMKDSEYASFI
ncbi:hypothetical protein OH77DRAFT_1364277, partial [Trametes cingulata]